jgi:hypothetical protein
MIRTIVILIGFLGAMFPAQAAADGTCAHVSDPSSLATPRSLQDAMLAHLADEGAAGYRVLSAEAAHGSADPRAFLQGVLYAVEAGARLDSLPLDRAFERLGRDRDAALTILGDFHRGFSMRDAPAALDAIEKAALERLRADDHGASERIAALAATIAALPTSFYQANAAALNARWAFALRDMAAGRADPGDALDPWLRTLSFADHPFAHEAARLARRHDILSTPLIRLLAKPDDAEAYAGLTRKASALAHRLRDEALAALPAGTGNAADAHEALSTLHLLAPVIDRGRASAIVRAVLARAKPSAEWIEIYDHLVRLSGPLNLPTAIVERSVRAWIQAIGSGALRVEKGWRLAYLIAVAAQSGLESLVFQQIRDMPAMPTAAAELYRIGLAATAGDTRYAGAALSAFCARADTSAERRAGRLLERALGGEPVLPPLSRWSRFGPFDDLQR